MTIMTSKIERKLREKDVKKAALVFGVDETIMNSMNEQCLLNCDYIIENLIRYDFNNIVRGLREVIDTKKPYTYQDVTLAIAKEYKYDKYKVVKIINDKSNDKLYFCKECGKRITYSQWEHRDRLCAGCLQDKMKAELL